ncbi:hypothetical protein [Micromonospora sp. NPDC007230]|uniref:WXG100-like domain-containing protein n=1 Tax=Micromonospora sp. NPDC007230 TaxID=3364237 RepID=UPI0036C9338A
MIAQPSEAYGLWPRVRALSGWPDTNEVQLGDLATAWQQSGGAFRAAAGTSISGLQSAWPDTAGTDFRLRTDELRRITEQTAELMHQLSTKAEQFGTIVRTVKEDIRRLVEENLEAFGRTWQLLDGVREAAQEEFVRQLATAVQQVIDAGVEATGKLGSATAAAIEQLNKIVNDTADNIKNDLRDKWFMTAGDAVNSAASTVAAHRFSQNPAHLPDEIAERLAAGRLAMRVGGGVAGLGVIYDATVGGKSWEQAFVSNGASFLASTATGALIGSMIPVPVLGTALGAAGGLVVGLLTSGTIDSLYANGGDLGKTISDGADAVVEFGGAVGEAWDTAF